MKIAVTGANGFVGVHLVRQLAKSHEVLGIDNLRYGPWRLVPAESSHLRLETVDLRERNPVGELIREYAPDAIVHLAAMHFIPECEASPDEAISTNTQATVNLLLACPPSCRFVFTSSAAVYSPSDSALREDVDAIGPVDVYGLTKWHGEDFVRHFTKLKSLESVIVRLFNVIGPGETNPHVLPEIIGQLKLGRRTLALGNVHPRRDYVYVADVADGFERIATGSLGSAAAGSPLVVNLGSGASYSVSEIVAKLGELVGEEISIESNSSRLRKVDRPQLLADNSRMQSIFQWTPRYDIDEALGLTWRNPDITYQGKRAS